MSNIVKWSQNVRISIVLYVASLLLTFSVAPIFSASAVITITVLIGAMFIYWGLSKALKLENGNISSAMFILGNIQIFYI